MLRKNCQGRTTIEPKEGQRQFLCSNKTPKRCPSLDFTSLDNSSEMEAVDCLAGILVSILLDRKKHGKQPSSNILPCINKRTS